MYKTKQQMSGAVLELKQQHNKQTNRVTGGEVAAVSGGGKYA